MEEGRSIVDDWKNEFIASGERHRLDISTSTPFLLVQYFYNKFLSPAILILGLVILLQQSDFIWMDWRGSLDSARAIGTVGVPCVCSLTGPSPLILDFPRGLPLMLP